MTKQKMKLPSTAVGRKRLLKLADMLETDASNKSGIRFDFTNWGYVGDAQNMVSCGTSACAMGLAAVSGAFRRQGLDCRIKQDGAIEIIFGKTKSPIRASARLFHISEGQATRLFALSLGLSYLHGARAERAVAKRIRDFVAGKTSP